MGGRRDLLAVMMTPELLADRLRRGWQPTPTPTRSGPQILGYAACAVRP
jgi:hypothetical protein